MPNIQVKEYDAWDLPTRIFHWVNVVAVLFSAAFGFLIMFRNDFGLIGPENKIALKELHTYIGYIFATNLGIRIIWFFFANRFSHWSMLAFSPKAFSEAGTYVKALKSGDEKPYIGHNPLAKLSVTLMFLLLVVLATTGLIRAGTDLYFPPFGGIIAHFVAKKDVNPETLKPADKTNVNIWRYNLVQRYKIPIGEIHIYASYIIILSIIVHIGAVIIAEKKEPGIISAMISGKKRLKEEPADGNQ